MNKLNPGIAATVKWLQENGFRTTDSGDGQTHDHACDLPVPYVHMLTEPAKLVSEVDRLVALLTAKGINLEPCNEDGTAPSVDGGYMPLSGVAHFTLWNVRLTETENDKLSHDQGVRESAAPTTPPP